MNEQNAIQTVTEEAVPTVLAEVQEAFFHIPFENSQFQIEAFVIAAQITPERAYRAIGLQLHSKIQAIMEAKKARALEDIDLEELDEEISTSLDDRSRRRAIIKRNFILANRPYADKLMNDALTDLNILYQHFKALPRLTREEFEAGEENYFSEKLTRQVRGLQGPQEALHNISTDLPNIKSIEQNYSALLGSEKGKDLLKG